MASILVPLLISVTEYLTNNLGVRTYFGSGSAGSVLSLGNMFPGLRLERISRQWDHVEGEASLGRKSIPKQQ